MQKSNLSRRHVIGGLAALGGLALAAKMGGFSRSDRQITNPGIQLYTLRKEMAESVPTTLYMLADFGYKEVEFAGYFDHSPLELSMMLADNGLTAPAAHVPLDDLAKELDMTIAKAIMVGHDYLVMPYLKASDRETIDQYKFICEIMNIAGEKCKDTDIQLCYHNHDFEFEAIDGVVPYDILLSECDADLVKMELDLFWAKKAGIDANALFKAHPGRFPLCHVKDMSAAGEMVDVGAGVMDFDSQIEVGTDIGGLNHYFVEHDNPTNAALSAKNSIAGMGKITF